MTDYTKLVEALRHCAESGDFNCNKDCPMYPNYPKCLTKMDTDAAAAIEALNRLVDLNTERCEALRKQLGEAHENYEKHLSELEAQLPKRGEWIKHPEVKNIYGGVYIECPFCGEKYVVQYIADEKFCRNCGADMRKMEVQDGQE